MSASLIANTMSRPWSSVVQVYATFPNGVEVQGSGVIVDRNSVLTAAHVVFDVDQGGQARTVRVSPGRDSSSAPFGTYFATEVTSYGAELDNNSRTLTDAETARDVALLSFSTELGVQAGGWMSVGSIGIGGFANVTGYPGTTPTNARDGTRMWSDSAVLANRGNGTLTTIDAFIAPGSSGGPAWIDADPGPGISPSLVGIVSSKTLDPQRVSAGFLTNVGPDNPLGRLFLTKMGSDNALLSGPLFDAAYYLAANPDVQNAVVNARAHFDTLGWREGRNPNALFDTKGYLASFADVRASGLNPLEHYRQFGWREGRDPSTAFDSGSYLATYRDVAASGLNPLDHYLRFGQAEGRLAFGDGTWT